MSKTPRSGGTGRLSDVGPDCCVCGSLSQCAQVCQPVSSRGLPWGFRRCGVFVTGSWIRSPRTFPSTPRCGRSGGDSGSRIRVPVRTAAVLLCLTVSPWWKYRIARRVVGCFGSGSRGFLTPTTTCKIFLRFPQYRRSCLLLPTDVGVGPCNDARTPPPPPPHGRGGRSKGAGTAACWTCSSPRTWG